MEDGSNKSNTDCLYYLASPLLCKKGDKCDYRHSEIARLNPQECYFWMQGKCLKPNCPFRHPPIQGNVKEEETNTNVCWFFQNSTCTKGEACTFLHSIPSQTDKLKDGKESDSVNQEDKSSSHPNSHLPSHSFPNQTTLKKLTVTVSNASPSIPSFSSPPSSSPTLAKNPMAMGSNKWVLSNQENNANKIHGGSALKSNQKANAIVNSNANTHGHSHVHDSGNNNSVETTNHLSHAQSKRYSWQNDKKEKMISLQSEEYQTISSKWAAANPTATVSLHSKPSSNNKNDSSTVRLKGNMNRFNDHHYDNDEDDHMHVLANADDLSSPGFDVIVDNSEKLNKRSARVEGLVQDRSLDDEMEDGYGVSSLSKRLLFDKIGNSKKKIENDVNRLKRPRANEEMDEDKRKGNAFKVKNNQVKSSTIGSTVAGNKMLRNVIESISQNNSSSVHRSNKEDVDKSLKKQNKIGNRLSYPEEEQAETVKEDERKGRMGERVRKEEDSNTAQTKRMVENEVEGVDFSAPKTLAEIREEKARLRLLSQSKEEQTDAAKVNVKESVKETVKELQSGGDEHSTGRVIGHGSKSLQKTTYREDVSVRTLTGGKEKNSKKLVSISNKSLIGFQPPEPLSAILERKKKMEAEKTVKVERVNAKKEENEEKQVVRSTNKETRVLRRMEDTVNEIASIDRDKESTGSKKNEGFAHSSMVKEDVKDKNSVAEGTPIEPAITKLENDDYIGLLDDDEMNDMGEKDDMDDFAFDDMEDEDLEKKLTGFFE